LVRKPSALPLVDGDAEVTASLASVVLQLYAMASHLDELLNGISRLERDVETELDRAGIQWRYHLEAGRVRFEREVRLAHRRLKQGLFRFLRESSIPNLLTAPVIYGMIVPIVILDVSFCVYQAICFPVYGIARVRRSDYLVMDRHHLAYLNAIEKLNCEYCGYANGVFAYVREIAARTEQYWCPIRHARRISAPHTRYRNFVDYGDAEGYHRRLILLRRQLPHDRGDDQPD